MFKRSKSRANWEKLQLSTSHSSTPKTIWWRFRANPKSQHFGWLSNPSLLYMSWVDFFSKRVQPQESMLSRWGIALDERWRRWSRWLCCKLLRWQADLDNQPVWFFDFFRVADVIPKETNQSNDWTMLNGFNGGFYLFAMDLQSICIWLGQFVSQGPRGLIFSWHGQGVQGLGTLLAEGWRKRGASHLPPWCQKGADPSRCWIGSHRRSF